MWLSDVWRLEKLITKNIILMGAIYVSSLPWKFVFYRSNDSLIYTNITFIKLKNYLYDFMFSNISCANFSYTTTVVIDVRVQMMNKIWYSTSNPWHFAFVSTTILPSIQIIYSTYTYMIRHSPELFYDNLWGRYPCFICKSRNTVI